MTKIMLVEDDKSLREIYGIRLIAEGYEIKSAGDGEEALAMAIKERPDLIISDVMMPKISGFDMLDILRSTPETKDVKIIMMTALSSEDQRARGESLGANRYLVKSQVGIEDVVRTVHDVLADAPVSTTPTNMFGSSMPTAATFAPKPVPITSDVQPANPAPVAPAPIMPQPTAPFSSPAPASLGAAQMVGQPQTASAPVVAPTPQPAPVVTSIPVTQPAPQPVAQLAPQPITEPTPAFQSTPTPMQATAPIPTQDVVIQQPAASTTPDIATLIAQELNEGNPAPQNPAQ